MTKAKPTQILDDGEIIEATEAGLNCYTVPTTNSVSITGSIARLTAAVVEVQRTIKPALKDSTNPHFKSKYADLFAIWEVAKAVLPANGLALMQFPTADGPIVSVTTILSHTSGEYIVATLTMMAQQTSPQGIGSTITYARRYALAAILSIVADEDDDGNAGSNGEHKAKNLASDEQLGAIRRAAHEKGVDADQVSLDHLGIPLMELQTGQAQGLFGHLKALPAKKKGEADAITEDQYHTLNRMLNECNEPAATFKLFAKKFGVTTLRDLKVKFVIAATEWLDAVLEGEAAKRGVEPPITSDDINFG